MTVSGKVLYVDCTPLTQSMLWVTVSVEVHYVDCATLTLYSSKATHCC